MAKTTVEEYKPYRMINYHVFEETLGKTKVYSDAVEVLNAVGKTNSITMYTRDKKKLKAKILEAFGKETELMVKSIQEDDKGKKTVVEKKTKKKVPTINVRYVQIDEMGTIDKLRQDFYTTTYDAVIIVPDMVIAGKIRRIKVDLLFIPTFSLESGAAGHFIEVKKGSDWKNVFQGEIEISKFIGRNMEAYKDESIEEIPSEDLPGENESPDE
jgi:hypothetical protein